MAEVRTAVAADNLLARHAVTRVRYRLHGFACQRQPEARPSGPRIEFVLRAEQMSVAAYAAIGSVGLVINKLACKRPLGSLLLRDPILLVAKLFALIVVRRLCVTHLCNFINLDF